MTRTSKRPRILLSGGTGFLGEQVLKFLDGRAHVTALSRSTEGYLSCDLTHWNGGLDPAKLRGAFDAFIHLAGQYDLRAERPTLYLNNITSTHTAMAIAEKAEIPCFVQASTIAVTMNQRGATAPVPPESLRSEASFPDAYSESKAHAEKIVRNWPSTTVRSRLICRLGALVGDSKEGVIRRIDGPYHAAKSLEQLAPYLSRFPGPLPLPGRADNPIPIVPVDAAARAIVELTLNEIANATPREPDTIETRSYYLVSRRAPSAARFFQSVLDHLRIDKKPLFVPGLPAWLARPAAEILAQLPGEELEYLVGLPPLDLDTSVAALGDDWCPEFDSYEKALWSGYEKFVSNR